MITDILQDDMSKGQFTSLLMVLRNNEFHFLVFIEV